MYIFTLKKLQLSTQRESIKTPSKSGLNS